MAVCVYSVFVLTRLSSGLATGWSPVQGVLSTVYKIYILELINSEWAKSESLIREIEEAEEEAEEEEEEEEETYFFIHWKRPIKESCHDVLGSLDLCLIKLIWRTSLWDLTYLR
jgi:hypothetical protein